MIGLTHPPEKRLKAVAKAVPEGQPTIGNTTAPAALALKIDMLWRPLTVKYTNVD